MDLPNKCLHYFRYICFMRERYIKACQSGIYFLLQGGQVVYIGKTKNISHRLAGHAGKNYDTYRFIPCEEVWLGHYEKRWIERFKPKYNSKKKIEENLKLNKTISITVNKDTESLLNQLAIKKRLKLGVFLRQAIDEKIAYEINL